ncbi:MAG: hypothetical protein ACO4AI_10450 [Prochlorothrix sp.]|nr:hypothetical protein [Prochlorothrix sp.]
MKIVLIKVITQGEARQQQPHTLGSFMFAGLEVRTPAPREQPIIDRMRAGSRSLPLGIPILPVQAEKNQT